MHGHRNESAVFAPLQILGRKLVFKFLIAKTRIWLAFLSFLFFIFNWQHVVFGYGLIRAIYWGGVPFIVVVSQQAQE